MERELSLVFVSSTNSYYNSSWDFSFRTRIYFTGKKLGTYRNVSFWQSWKASSWLNSAFHYTTHYL